MSSYQQPPSPDIYSRMVEQADQLAKDRVERNAEIARLRAENQRLREALADKTARLDIALGVFDDYDEARIDYESLVEYAEDEALAGDAE